MRKMLSPQSVLILLLLIASLTGGSQDWAPWSTLPEPASMQCTVCVIQEAVLMGGRRDDGISNAIVAVNIMNRLVNAELSPALPIHSTGQFCARSGLGVLASIQGSTLAPVSPTPDYNVYTATFSSIPGPDGYSTSTSWISIGKGKYNRTRTGFGSAAGEMTLFMFGGVTSANLYTNLIEAYNQTSQKWIPVGYMPRSDSIFSTYCNCQTSEHRYVIVLVCQQCSPQPNERGLMKILVYDLTTFSFGNTLIHDFGSYFLSIRSVSLSHFVVMMVVVSNSTNPIMFYYDVFQNQISYVITSDFPELRSHGSVFPITTNMYFAGGEYVNGSLSDEVDTVPALPAIAVVPDHTNYTYFVGQNITFSVGICNAGLSLRLASTPSCGTPLEGVPDMECSVLAGGNGQVVIPVGDVPAGGVAICLSTGYCPKANESRVSCASSGNYNFEDCLFDNCCWDADAQECFQYAYATEEQRHYFLANVAAITIVFPESDNQSAFEKFITGVTGIITVVAVALVLIVGGGALAWRILRATPDEEPEEGSAHPLDQHGKYKVLCKLGQGGFGTVYLVARKSDSERFAMKYIICKDEEERNYAIKEFELLHDSQGHPNMIRLIEMFMNWTDEVESIPTVNYSGGDEDDPTQARLLQKRCSSPNGPSSRGGGSGSSGGRSGSPSTRSSRKSTKSKKETQMPLLQMAPKYVCIVMDYCPEGDLAHYILRTYQLGTTVAETMVLQVLQQCCSLLCHLHGLRPPIVHRDLKPENILIKDNGTHMIVTDFGLAQQIEKSYLTTRAGSLHYVAPECWKRHYTAAVDVWAMGCIAYGMCTGRVTAETARVMFSDARDKNFERSIRQDLRGYSDKLRNIVIGMLQTTAAKRLTTSQVLEVLETADGRLPAGATPGPAPSPAKTASTLSTENQRLLEATPERAPPQSSS
ncbi:protein kinase, putative [Bodo saltans]|uniref:non-specific serine/threonine protein kinase n=1 Tax=Bodo saltans TaxID=75058 RepID=A0A0S4IN64_BODSA|nr:protein kinase, putative [Bodo saltans]|eukprot:CUE70433.1 protein kinase, putative [Bodo saltans]